MIIHEDMVRFYQDEMLTHAEQNRMISIAKGRPFSVNSYYAQILAWLGNIMCSWGSQLVKRFGKKTDSYQAGSIGQKVNA
jgi:hypothetical protein